MPGSSSSELLRFQRSLIPPFSTIALSSSSGWSGALLFSGSGTEYAFLIPKQGDLILIDLDSFSESRRVELMMTTSNTKLYHFTSAFEVDGDCFLVPYKEPWSCFFMSLVKDSMSSGSGSVVKFKMSSFVSSSETYVGCPRCSEF